MSVEHLPDGTPYLDSDSYLSDTPKYTQEMARQVSGLGGGGGGGIEVVTELPDTADEGTLLNYYVPPGDEPHHESGTIWTLRYSPLPPKGEPLDDFPWECVGGGYAYGYQITWDQFDWKDDDDGDEEGRIYSMECPIPLAGYYRFDLSLRLACWQVASSTNSDSIMGFEMLGTKIVGPGPPHLDLYWRSQEGSAGKWDVYRPTQASTNDMSMTFLLPPQIQGPRGPIGPWPADDAATPRLFNPAEGNGANWKAAGCHVGSMPWRVAGTASGRAMTAAAAEAHAEDYTAMLAAREAKADEENDEGTGAASE